MSAEAESSQIFRKSYTNCSAWDIYGTRIGHLSMKMKNDQLREITSLDIQKNAEILVYRSDDSLELKVLFEKETVWLSQKQIAELFQTARSNVTKHIKNIFDEEEFSEDSVSEDFSHTAADGKSYRTRYYCLDVILSVGRRVKSKQGASFSGQMR